MQPNSFASLQPLQKKQFTSCVATFAINGAVALCIGALLPYIRDTYSLGYAFAGLLVSLHSVGNLVSSFLTGLLLQRLGRKISMMLFSSMIVLAFSLMTLAKSPSALAIAFLLSGLGRGAVSNFNNTIITEIAPSQAWALNTLHAFFAIGAFLAPIGIMLFTKNTALGWRAMCVFMTVAGFAELIIYALMPQLNNKTKNINGNTKNFLFLKEPSFLLSCGTLFFYLCAEQGVIGWMVTYFKDSGLMSASYAQGMASVLWVLILIGRLTVAALSRRFRKSNLLCFMASGFLMFFAVVLLGKTLPTITIGIAGFGFCMAGIYPTTVSLCGNTINRFPLAWSFMLTIASFGSIIMPVIIGAVAQQLGIFYGICTIIIAIIAAVGFIVANVFYTVKYAQVN